MKRTMKNPGISWNLSIQNFAKLNASWEGKNKKSEKEMI